MCLSTDSLVACCCHFFRLYCAGHLDLRDIFNYLKDISVDTRDIFVRDNFLRDILKGHFRYKGHFFDIVLLRGQF